MYLLSVCWPQPAVCENGRWTSAPDWDAPVMSMVPSWQFRTFERAPHFALDWNEWFRSDLNRSGQPTAGEMRGFHIVFRLRVQRGGKLAFFDTDGCIIRQNGEIVHEDREAHPLMRHELMVDYGDYLEIAHWQSGGPWSWGARWEKGSAAPDEMLLNVMARYRPSVEDALTTPNGPALKVYTHGADPVRCALSVYSMVINGYRPAAVQIFGDYQWTEHSRSMLTALLPFADIVDCARVNCALEKLNPELVPLARSTWAAMKICVGLFVPPSEYCLLDDDIFVLDRLDDALHWHEEHTLVYATDIDYSRRYRDIWCADDPERPLLGTINTGFYLIRNTGDLRQRAERMLATPLPLHKHPAWMWEQGFFAWEFAPEPTKMLPSQRYFYPVHDGLPGGLLGYDWAKNPCGFAWVHFGGPKPKPDDDHAGGLVPAILGRARAKR